MQILRTESAELDLDKLVEHYGSLNPNATLAMLDRIAETESLLTRYPRLERLGRITGTREMVVTHTPFIIIYTSDTTSIIVLRVLHSHQQWPQSHGLA